MTANTNDSLLRVAGSGDAWPEGAMGIPGVPTPVVLPAAPTADAPLDAPVIPVMTHSAALASPIRPITFKDASSGVITTIS
jgi:hypothetical protein